MSLYFASGSLDLEWALGIGCDADLPLDLPLILVDGAALAFDSCLPPREELVCLDGPPRNGVLVMELAVLFLRIDVVRLSPMSFPTTSRPPFDREGLLLPCLSYSSSKPLETFLLPLLRCLDLE